MPLPAGTRIGSFTCEAQIGAGGMGEVYRATDTHLKRAVALKVLPASVAGDADRLARFRREAEVLASLNHPNIAAIYGLEQTTSLTALVMELVEGDDLSVRIARGPIPLDEALPIARQIAAALEAAHDAGIIHRDLKPANIKVRHDGTVKVLDFGLAKAISGDAARSGADVMNSPTMTSPAMTAMGMILGTAAYMSPEQAKGRAVDRRADVWAFGVVLCEMLTGQRVFSGDDVSELLVAVLRDVPDFDRLPPATPSGVRRLLRRCLEKDPRKRLRDMGDVVVELDEAMSAPDQDDRRASAAPPTARDALSPRMLGALGVLVLAVGAAGAVGGWALSQTEPVAPATTTRFLVDLPGAGEIRHPVLTPDGRYLVFAASGRLYRRDLATFDSTPMAGTDGAASPFISSTGRWVGFFANGKIKKVALAGGDAQILGDADADTPGAAFGPGDIVVFTKGWSTALFMLPAEGGEVEPFTELDRAKGERGHWTPHMVPGEQFLLFTIWMNGVAINDARVGLLDLTTRKYRALFPGAGARYLRSGHILYFHAGIWHTVPFDAASGTTTGDPVTVLDDAMGLEPDGGPTWHALSTSDNGTLAYLPGPVRPKRDLAWVDRAGNPESLGLPPRAIDHVNLSPDGSRAITARLEGGIYELWMNDLARKTEDRIDVAGSSTQAFWHPSGSEIAFVTTRKGEYDTIIANADGTNERAVLVEDFDEAPAAWTKDGRLLIRQWRLDGSRPVVLINPAVPATEEVLVPGNVGTTFVVLSPDEKWLMYSSGLGGSSEVYVQPFPTGSSVMRISNGGGVEPQWSRTTSEAFFRKGDAVVSVPFRVEAGRFVPGAETPLFTLASSFQLYGTSLDGRRFLVARRAEPEPAPGIRIVLNWFEELTARRK